MKKTIALFAAFLLVACALPVCVSAQDAADAEPKKPTAEELFTIPADATAEQLEERLMEIMAFQPEGITSLEAYQAYMEKQMAAMKQIAEQMLKCKDATEEQKDTAYTIKLQTIMMGAREDTDKTLVELEAYQKELAEAKSDVLYQAQVMTFQLKLQKPLMAVMMNAFMQGDDDEEEGEGEDKPDHAAEIKKIFEEIKTFLGENEFRDDYAILPQMMLQVAGMIDDDGKEGLQKSVIAELKPILEKSDSKAAKAVLERMEGVLRFAELPGTEIELQCVLLDGKKLDIKEFRGKVVLVDFWATWCGPCRAAIPTMKKLYDEYHEKGFELIAYSCDDDIDDLKKFEEDSPHPWQVASVVLSVEQELKDYSDFYGIPGYPTFVLVDKEGKVVHVTHGINEIAEKLAEMIPDDK